MPISVVIPTHNRADCIERMVNALNNQSGNHILEIIFVSDGCTDNTKSVLSSAKTEIPIKATETPGVGAACARNRGAQNSSGDIILFLDDDILPEPGVAQAHLAVHNKADGYAVVGPCPFPPDWYANPIDQYAREWWRTLYQNMADPRHKFTFKDCLSGNMSIRRTAFDSLGGFDEEFAKAAREDYEFGVRLLKSGFRIQFAPDAVAYHYTTSTPADYLMKSYISGKADIYLVKKHPETFEMLPVHHFCRDMGMMKSVLKFAVFILSFNDRLVIKMLGRLFEGRISSLDDSTILSLWKKCLGAAYLLGLVRGTDGFGEFEELLNSHRSAT